MRVLVAFDKFKDSLTAPEACAIATDSLRDVHPDWTFDLCPLTDGGEGFCDILTAAAHGTVQIFSVAGPRGPTVEAPVGFVALEKIPRAARTLLQLETGKTLFNPHEHDHVAIVEMASASGLALLHPRQRDPWQTSSLGTGQLIQFAANHGAIAILLGVGGSATHDLGLGALSALGVDSLEADGARLVPPLPICWPSLTRFSGHVSASLPPLRIACDVANPLLGPHGAAAVYGPQKGLRPEDLIRLEEESTRLAHLLTVYCRQPDTLVNLPGSGAAGGIAFGLVTAARARIVAGFDLVSAWFDLDARIAAADLVLTGEGRFDASSLDGKGPGAVAARALAAGKSVHVFAGAVAIDAKRPGLVIRAITPHSTPLEEALRDAPENLAASVRKSF